MSEGARRYRVVIEPPAISDLEIAMGFIERDASRETAVRWFLEVSARIDSLCEHPRRFARAREAAVFPDRELRQIVVHSHRILFVIEGDLVRVFHVRHARRDDLSA